MPLTIIDKNQIHPIITKAIQADLNTKADPGDGGKNLETNPDGTQGGLYGGLNDAVDPVVRFEDAGKKATRTQLALTTAIVDNRNGKTPTSSVKLIYIHEKKTTQSHEVSHTFNNKLGVEVTAKAEIPFIAEGGLKFTYEFSYEYKFTDTTSTETSDTIRFEQEVQVKVPKGKVYKVVLVGDHTEGTVQTHHFVNITGTSSAWFGHTVNGHFNWNYPAAYLWRLIHDKGAADQESGAYGAHGDDHGWISQHGEITGAQVINFRAHTEDITGHPDAIEHRIEKPYALPDDYLKNPNIVKINEFGISPQAH